MSEQFIYVYVHGFLNDEKCKVGLKLRNCLKAHGINVETLDAKGSRGYFDGSVSSGLNAVEEFYQKQQEASENLVLQHGWLDINNLHVEASRQS